MPFLRGKYGPYAGFDVGDLTRKRYTELVVRKAGMFPGDRALDVACGHGTLSNAIARAFTKCRVVGVDSEAGEVATARENARIEDVRGRLDLVEALPEDLPFKDETFHLTTCALGLAFEKSHLEVLAEIHRVTAFYGKILLVDADFSKAAKRPSRAKRSVFGPETQAAMREMGFGKIAIQRVDTLRDGTMVQLLTAKRFDPDEAEDEADDEADEDEA